MRFEPYHPDHVAGLRLQDAQSGQRITELMTQPDYAGSIAVPGLAWSALSNDGCVLGCAGILPQWPGRAQAWALIGCDMPSNAWTAIVRQSWRILGQAHLYGYSRIEAQVLASFEPGVRFARLLGFNPEALLERWGPEGADYLQYVRFAP